MTVANIPSTITYVGNGATLAFPVSFTFFDSSELYVTVGGVAQTLNVDFSVVGEDVIFATAPLAAVEIVITRAMEFTQDTNLVNQGAFFAESIERAIDRVVAMVQQLKDGVLTASSVIQGSDASASTVVATGGTAPRTLAARFGEEINVRDFGASPGAPAATNVAAIQAAIDYAKTVGTPSRAGADGYTEHDGLGTSVYIPEGRYDLNAKLVMPRSGLYNAHTVRIVGAGMTNTTLVAAAGFPTDAGIIEWEAVAKRTFSQKILDIGFDIDGITGAKAIWFKPTSKADYNAIHAEGFYALEVKGVRVIARPTRNAVCIKIEGRADVSNFEDILHDGTLDNTTDQTIILEFDYDTDDGWLTTSQRGSDGPGCNYSTVKNIRQGMRGGLATLLKGRMCASVISDIFSNGGPLGAPCLHLKNSALVKIFNFSSEGKTEQEIIFIDNCDNIGLNTISLGKPDGAAGIGIKVINSRFVKMDNRWATSATPSHFSQGGKLISIDNLSTHCEFLNITGSETFANEIDWGSPGTKYNKIEYWDVKNSIRTLKDETVPTIAAIAGNPAVLADAATKADVNAVLTALRNAGLIN